MCVTTQQDRCEAIRKMKRPHDPKSARRFVGAVNYVSQFFSGIQGVMKPIHQLARKHKRFFWDKEHEESFQKIKEMLISPAILYMPSSEGKITLYSDTSRKATGSYLTQMIDGKERLIAYYSKVLPSACMNYSVTELELFGLMINIFAFKYLLRGIEFEVFVDHSALVQILTSKEEPCTDRIRKMLFKLSDYVFNVKYMKGTTLVLADMLSRAPRSNDTEFDIVEPVSFSESIQNGDEIAMPVQPVGTLSRPVTRAYAKSQGIHIPDLHQTRVTSEDVNSSVDQTESTGPTDSPQALNDTTETSDRGGESVVNTTPEPISEAEPVPSLETPELVLGRDAVQDTEIGRLTSPSITARKVHNWSGNPKRNVPPGEAEPLLLDRLREQNVKNNMIEIPDELYCRSEPIIRNVDSLITKSIPKQAELNKLMEVIKRKIIRDFNLPIDCKLLKVEQETSPYFKPIYDFLAHDILPSNVKAARSIKYRAEEYIMCNGLLFRLVYKDKEQEFKLQIAIPESMVDKIIMQFHDTILSSHQGVTRTYLTIRKHFYFPKMFERISGYIKSCLRCQEFRGKPDTIRPFHCRIPEEYRPFGRISIDCKTMPNSYTGYKHILVICDEITRFVICIPLKTLTAEVICEAIIQKVVGIFGPPSCIISDAASALTGKVVTLLCDALQIDRKVVSVENHGSLQVERHIQTIANFLKKHLNQFGKDWVRFISTTCYAYNSFSSPYLGDYSPFELALGRAPPNVTGISWNPIKGLTHSCAEYVEHMKNKFENVGKVVLSLQEKHQEAQRLASVQKLDKMPIYSRGQLVYLYKPTSSSLTANSKKIAAQWCGPLVIHEVLDRTHFVLATLKGEVLTDVFNFNRLKPCFLRYLLGKPITHLQGLKEALGQAKCNEVTKVSVETIDENGKKPQPLDGNQIFSIFQDRGVNLDDYLPYAEVNNGIATQVKLSDEQLVKQLNLVEAAPVREYFEVKTGRFKAGQLELLFRE